jgi:3-hydroxybutyryl-CoA dehydrogenase
MMGKNIGYVFASNPSFQVGMYDLYPTDVEAGIRTNTKQLLDKGVITEQELSDRLSRISFTNDIDSDLVKNADLVIEAVFEDMKIKRETFAKLEARCRPDTIFCTNSSVMSPSEISAELKHRERFVGTHFWNPGHLIPLVEVVKSDASSDEVAQTVMEVLRSVGKKPVLCKKDVPGFIANRLQLALYREVQDLVMRGVCSVEDADKALVYGPGLRWAIFGHNMIMQLGNPGGLTGMVNMLGNSGDRWLADMASWTHQPDNWAEVAQPGVDEEMKHFPDHIGHTNEACAAYRDQMLIELLKLHKKL